MGHIKGFEYDIFISYNHADDLKGVVGRDHAGWVGAFATKLENALQHNLKHECERVGRDIKIFWDYRLEKDRPFDGNLRQKVEDSAMFLMIMSNNYLQSEWCKQEWNWFVNVIHSRRHSLVSAEDWYDWWPAIIAHVGPTDRNKMLDDTLRSTTGFNFYDETRVGRDDPRFNYPSTDVNQADNALFFREFNELQTTLATRFRKILDHQSAGGGDVTTGPQTQSVVVLATKDLESECDQFKDRFHESGARMDEPSFSCGDAGTDTDEIHDLVSRSSALVLLLGHFPGEERVSAGMRAALDAAKKSNVPAFLWLQPDLSPELIESLPDKKYQNYKALVREVREHLDQSDLDQLTMTVRKKIASPAESSSIGDSKRVKLFIDADKLDLHLAEQVVDILKQPKVQTVLEQRKVKLRTWLARGESDQRDHAELWDKRVKRSDGVIIVYGLIDEDAVDNKLDQIDRVSTMRKLEQSTDQKGDIGIAILEGPPPGKGIIMDPDVRVLKWRSGIKEEQIIDFVSELASRFDRPSTN